MDYEYDDFIDHEDYSGDEYLSEEESYRRYLASNPDEDEEWQDQEGDVQPEINGAIEDMQTDN